MSMRYKGATLSSTAPVTTGGESGTAPGAWTLEQQAQAQAAGLWPIQPVPKYVEDVFSTWLYTGTGATQTITNGIDVTGKGALVWLKNRSSTNNHFLFDTARGVGTGTQALSSNTTDAGGAGADIAFTSTGFNLTQTGSNTNASSNNYASWTFRKQPKFFDIVTYTGNGTTQTISHNLGSVPGCIIVKSTSTVSQWNVYHRSLGATQALKLQSTGAATSSVNFWNDTNPTTTQFTVGSSFNTGGETYVAYIFAHDAGGFGALGTDNVISCGTCSSDASGYIQPVSLGYEPQWVMLKRTNSTANWVMMDTMRGMANTAAAASPILLANLSNAEAATGVQVNPTATGFEDTLWGGWGASNTYIYIAIRRGPMKVPTLGTSVFSPVSRTGTDANAIVTAGFAPDLLITKNRFSSVNDGVLDKLRGLNNVLITSSAAVEDTSQTDLMRSWNMTGLTLGPDANTSVFNWSGNTYINYMFQRAPSFFDEVCYTGTGVARTVEHNLTVAPELIIAKTRVGLNTGWITYCSYLPAPLDDRLSLGTDAAKATSIGTWKIPTTTTWGMDISFSAMNQAGSTYVSYLFATCAGVSKVGSYTGTGTTQTINCGFTAGARFVLIKRTDSTGDWYVWDSARGIVAGNDPYILLNSVAAEVTGTDYVDTAATGFEISSTAPAAINANGGSFIFLAVS